MRLGEEVELLPVVLDVLDVRPLEELDRPQVAVEQLNAERADTKVARFLVRVLCERMCA